MARFFERIADHAVDIGEHVRFMVTGSVQDDDDEAPLSPSRLPSVNLLFNQPVT